MGKNLKLYIAIKSRLSKRYYTIRAKDVAYDNGSLCHGRTFAFYCAREVNPRRLKDRARPLHGGQTGTTVGYIISVKNLFYIIYTDPYATV